MVAFFHKGDSLMKQNRKGFTLIELLIVIVIIGILVAVLIAVINPARARNRAKDAGIEAAMSKLGLSIQGYMSAYGTYPDCADLDASIDNNGTVNTIANGCTFTIPSLGNELFTYTYNNTAAVPYYYLSRLSIGLNSKNFIMYSGDGYSGKIYACATSAGNTPATTDLNNTATCQDLTK